MNRIGLFYTPTWSQPASIGIQEQYVDLSITAFVSLAVGQQWQKVGRQIHEFGRYGDNWDGFDSRAPRLDTVSRANEFLNGAKAHGAPPPTVAVLSPDGTISIEWRSNGYYLQADIGTGANIELVQFGPHIKPVRWVEPTVQDGDVRGETWDSVQRIGGGSAASILAP